MGKTSQRKEKSNYVGPERSAKKAFELNYGIDWSCDEPVEGTYQLNEKDTLVMIGNEKNNELIKKRMNKLLDDFQWEAKKREKNEKKYASMLKTLNDGIDKFPLVRKMWEKFLTDAFTDNIKSVDADLDAIKDAPLEEQIEYVIKYNKRKYE